MMTNLIYDRTLEDVSEVRRLLAKLDPETGDGLTAAEQAKWDAGLKGAYNFTDLNRVEAAVKTLAASLTSAGYPVGVTPVLKGSSRVPVGYTEVEWIQSSGTQYIDTGVVPDGETSVDVSFLVTDLPSDYSKIRPVYGAAANFDSNAFEFWALDGGFATYGTQAYKSNLGAVANAIQTVSQDKNALTVNGAESTFTKQTFTAPYTMLLFATHRNGGINICEATANLRIYSFVIKSGAVHKNFVPCKNPDGVVGLYDLIGGEFYGNSGTGAFTAGAEVGKAEDREWQEGDIVRRAQWSTYLDNVQRLRDAYYTLADTGELPKPEDKLGYVGANNIEKVLADIDLLIGWMKSSYRRCGTFRAGNNAAHLPLKGSV